MIFNKFCQLIGDIEKHKNEKFSGIGLVLYRDSTALPISPLNLNHGFNLPVQGYYEILDILLEISIISNPFHDGFHLLNRNFELTHLSQYFSTPIVETDKVEYKFGSRYRTAFYGSFLENIDACGIIGNNHGPIIFRKGEKINPLSFI